MKKIILLITMLFAFAGTAQTASDYFETAKKDAAKRKHYKAIPNFKKAIALDSTNLEYYWFLSASILKENIRGAARTEYGIFEGLEVLNVMLSKGAKSIKIYDRIITANEYILDDYMARYLTNRSPKIEDWQDADSDTSEKDKYKNIAETAFSNIVVSCEFILQLEPSNKFATQKLKYLKKPVFVKELPE